MWGRDVNKSHFNDGLFSMILVWSPEVLLCAPFQVFSVVAPHFWDALSGKTLKMQHLLPLALLLIVLSSSKRVKQGDSGLSQLALGEGHISPSAGL